MHDYTDGDTFIMGEKHLWNCIKLMNKVISQNNPNQIAQSTTQVFRLIYP